jgi:general stress protein 26
MELREKILEVIGGPHTAAVATLDGKQPAVRFMLLMGFPDMTLVGMTKKSSRKAAQLKKNADVAIAMWSGKEFTDPYVEILAKANIHEDIATKKKYWNPVFIPYFKSLDNPDFIVLKFTAEEITYFVPSMAAREVWKR